MTTRWIAQNGDGWSVVEVGFSHSTLLTISYWCYRFDYCWSHITRNHIVVCCFGNCVTLYHIERSSRRTFDRKWTHQSAQRPPTRCFVYLLWDAHKILQCNTQICFRELAEPFRRWRIKHRRPLSPHIHHQSRGLCKQCRSLLNVTSLFLEELFA